VRCASNMMRFPIGAHLTLLWRSSASPPPLAGVNRAKGLAIKGLKFAKSASREAFEEADVKGRLAARANPSNYFVRNGNIPPVVQLHPSSRPH
jgi:hypothetical protein